MNATVNDFGLHNTSVDGDKFQEHKVKQVKHNIDNLHGQVGNGNIEKTVQALDIQIKISEQLHDEFQLKGKRSQTSYDYVGVENRSKIQRMFNDIQPFSNSRPKVTLKNPVQSSLFSFKPGVISKFVERNKKNFNRRLTFVEHSNDSDDDYDNDNDV